MKAGHWIAALGGLNLVLVWLLVRQPAQRAAMPSPLPATAHTPSPSRVKPAIRPAPYFKTVLVTNQMQWDQLESSDYQQYIARLRTVGCPEETIRDLIIADLEKAYAPRLRALYPAHKDLKYWQSVEEELLNEVDYQAVARQERALDLEKRKVIKDLVGADLFTERQKAKGQSDYYERRLAFLPEEKRDQVRALLEQHHDRDWAIREKQWQEAEPLTAADRTELRRLRQEKEAALGQMLAPEEREQFELWMSPSADSVRRALYGMQATEQEFLAVFKLRQAFDQAWNRDDLEANDPAVQAQWQQAEQALNDSIREALGEPRFAEYQRGSDPAYHELNQLATRYQLPRTKAAEVYDYKQTLLAHRQQVEADAALTPEQKAEVLAALAAEAQRSVKAALGDKAYRQYWRSADWLQK